MSASEGNFEDLAPNSASRLLGQVSQQGLIELPGLWIGSQAIKGLGDELPVYEPTTGRCLGTTIGATVEQVDLAVQTARSALPAWKETSRAQRAAILHRIADTIEQQRTEFSTLQSLSNGKPPTEAAIDVTDAIATYRYYAALCASWELFDFEPTPVPDISFKADRRYAPVGVAVLILPWNFPLVTAAWKIAPALAAGCTLIVKPSEVAPLPEHALASLIAQCGLPGGVLNWVFGGANVGRALINHSGVDKVSFTGSTIVGRQVMQAAVNRFTRLGLELGGKSSLIVCSTADLDHAVELAASGIFTNAGQMCSATSRILVHSSLYGAFVIRLAAIARELQPVSVGVSGVSSYAPLISKAQQHKVLALIRSGIGDGIKAVAGGGIPAQAPEGFYVEPTVLIDVPLDHSLWRDEIFGPVACLRSFNTEEEAVSIANNTEYGLAATVVGEDSNEVQRVAGALRAGIVWQNVPQVVFPEVGWGGFGSSGIGRELGVPGLRAYQESRHFLRSATKPETPQSVQLADH